MFSSLRTTNVFIYFYYFHTCRYEKQLQTFCNFMDSILDSPTPEIRHDVESLTDRLKDKLRKSVFWSHRLQQALSLGQKDIV